MKINQQEALHGKKLIKTTLLQMKLLTASESVNAGLLSKDKTKTELEQIAGEFKGFTLLVDQTPMGIHIYGPFPYAVS